MPKRDMLINFVHGEECRIAIVEDGKLQELYTERADDNLHVGNIYRGRVTNVEPSIQAAFVDFGIGRNGFLHISDVHPRYFPGEDEETTEKVGKKTPRRDRPPIQKCLRRGDKVLVQVLKEGIGTKGPTLTSYLSIPGRFIVMLPNMERSGVSRKVEDDEARREARKILQDLDTPDGFGFIVRTAGIGRTKTELKRDLAYLNRLWKSIDTRMARGSGPAELYRESDLTIRTIRDVLSSDIDRIIVDEPDTTKRVREFVRIAMPRGGTTLQHYSGQVPLFDAFDIERQIVEIHSREVQLPSGGSIIIEQTEALVAIDVNSGKNRDNADAEMTAWNTNKEAADEIARQLRLRDLGGMIVNDFIDMYVAKHRSDIEKRFRDNLKGDRARIKLVRINELGLLAMTRQRMRPSLKKSLYDECQHCSGTGHIKSKESVAMDVIRRLAVALSHEKIDRVRVILHPKVITALINRKRQELVDLERRQGKKVEIVSHDARAADQIDLEAYDAAGVMIELDRLPKPKLPQKSELEAVDAKWQPPARPAHAAGPDAPAEDDISDLNFDDDAEDSEESTDSSPPEKTRSRKKADTDNADQSDDSDGNSDGDGDGDGEGGKRRRRRRRRGGRGRRGKSDDSANNDNKEQSNQSSDSSTDSDSDQNDSKSDTTEDASASDADADASENSSDTEEKKPRRRRRRSRSKKSETDSDTTSDQSQEPDPPRVTKADLEEQTAAANQEPSSKSTIKKTKRPLTTSKREELMSGGSSTVRTKRVQPGRRRVTRSDDKAKADESDSKSKSKSVDAKKSSDASAEDEKSKASGGYSNQLKK